MMSYNADTVLDTWITMSIQSWTYVLQYECYLGGHVLQHGYCVGHLMLQCEYCLGHHVLQCEYCLEHHMLQCRYCLEHIVLQVDTVLEVMGFNVDSVLDIMDYNVIEKTTTFFAVFACFRKYVGQQLHPMNLTAACVYASELSFRVPVKIHDIRSMIMVH